MKRENVLLGLVIVLVLLNGAVLFYFLGGRRPGPPPHDKRIVEALHFDGPKRAEFEKLKRDHRGKMNDLDKQFNDLLDDYFQTLNSRNDAVRDSLQRQIGDIEQQRVRITWEHFQDLRKLTGDDEVFNAFVPELVRFIVQRGPKDGPPPHARP